MVDAVEQELRTFTQRLVDLHETTTGLHTQVEARGAVDLEPSWTLEAAADPESLVRQPDPKSHAGYTRLIGHSPSAGVVITVIIDPYDGSGVTAWITRGADLRQYLDSKEFRDD